MRKRTLFVVAGAVAIAGLGGAAAIVSFLGSREARTSVVRVTPPLAIVQLNSWNETHPAIEMHAQRPEAQGRDTTFVSNAVADVPADFLQDSAVLRFMVAVPQWAVFSKSGIPFTAADGVVLVAWDPDAGIGLEIGRLELNPVHRASDRKWHELDVRLQPCTRRVELEVLPGTGTVVNNSYDRLHVAAPEGMIFRRGRAAPQPIADRVCAGSDQLRDCAAGTGDCGDMPNPPPPAGSLRTGAARRTTGN